MGWAPNAPNSSGSTRAVYDPVAHTTTMYTFQPASVSRQEGKGDALLRRKTESDLQRNAPWHGRRKGVVEFVDRTSSFAVNANQEYLNGCLKVRRAPHARPHAPGPCLAPDARRPCRRTLARTRRERER